MNAEFFTLTYGSLVVQLMKDLEDVQKVNQQLEKMGHSIGVRLVEEFLAKSGVANCNDFTDTADLIAKVAFKMFLGVPVDVTSWNSDKTVCPRLLARSHALRRLARCCFTTTRLPTSLNCQRTLISITQTFCAASSVALSRWSSFGSIAISSETRFAATT